MNTFHAFGFVVIVHITVITSVAMLFVCFARHRSAFQHTVGIVGLLLSLSSPILVLALPQPNWLHLSRISKAQPDLGMSKSQVDVPTFSGSGPVSPSAHELATTESTASSGPQTSTTHDRIPLALAVHFKTIFAASMNSLFAVWLLGSVLALYRFWKSRRLLRCLSHSWTTISSVRLEQIQQEVCEVLGVKQLPPIQVADSAPIPLVLGVWKPVVVLPRDVADSASHERLRDVLIHECAHIARRDPWVHALQPAAAILFWIHPGIYWLNQQISRVREELCDNFVIRQGDAADYAQTLLVLSEFCGRQRYSVSTLGLFTSRWTLEERIRDLLDSKRKTITQTRWDTRLGLGVLGVISVLIGGVGVVGVSSADQQAEISKTLKAEDPAAKTEESTQVPKMRKIIIRGECIDDDLNAIPNVAIRVFRYKSITEPPALVASAKSDSDGRFKLENVESADRNVFDLFPARAAGHASIIKQIHKDEDDDDIELTLSSKPQTLSGKVTDVNGQPIPKVLVSQFPLYPSYPPPGVLSAITDEQGRYEITDATEWIRQDRQGITKRTIQLHHPDFPTATAHYTTIPQVLNVTLKPPAIVEGQVIDTTTNKPLPHVTVRAQGVARHRSFEAKTDDKGRYRLRMTKDHYNIWAEMDERIAIAVKAIEAVPGETLTDADIEMVQGGFVVGTVINGDTNEPITFPQGKTRYVANYGPGRPSTGAAVNLAKINSDGTYRFRVAPGLNYVYLMSGDMAEYVTVEDGEEVKLDLISGKSEPEKHFRFDPDVKLRAELMQKARKEDADEAAGNEN